MLQGFTVRKNVLHGSIPASIFNISSLRILELSENQFSGSIPPTMGTVTLPNLENLYLHTNSFTGPIPISIANASNLNLLDISMNSFTGFLPNLSNLHRLQYLSIVSNNLTSPKSPTQEVVFLTWLSNCKSLKMLDISYNPLNGVLPPSIGNFSDSLQLFWARACNFRGAIPPEVGNLTGLLVMYWSENHFTGFIPPTIAKMKQLQVLSLRGSRLQGSIPRELCGMSNLGDLLLMKNMLTGPIPECLGQLQSLRKLFLNSNNLNSTIPSSLWNLRDLVGLDLSSNNLGGNLSSQIGGLKVLTQVNLSFNQFSGNIPSLIDGCQSLQVLPLSNNKFEGSIPQSLGNIRGLILLDLSNNNLSGSIPKSLQNLPFLSIFNVSYNSLEGEIPNLNFSAESFAHNSALCGAIEFGVPPCIVNERRSRSKNAAIHLVKYILPPVVSAITLGILVCACSRKRKSKQIPPAPAADDGVLAGISWRRVSHRELQLGTNDFSEDNMLGRGSFGSVFKGTLSHELNVAVKVFNLELEGALKSFETEGEILGSVRHRNLVRIIGEVVVQTKTLATVGYAAPEYGSEGKVSTKGDVYSYGIMLLEIFTRKKPTDEMFGEEMELKKWVSGAMQENRASGKTSAVSITKPVPSPKSMLNIGQVKHPAMAIASCPALATATSATTSAIEFPHASTVNPRIKCHKAVQQFTGHGGNPEHTHDECNYYSSYLFTLVLGGSFSSM
ncbi:hypothetical protein C2S51_021937 [Perilla frutescens var. frutescens]|nr:hypothetical protein C2S51_021937 [Perilla frutescens var. frutescens]